VSLLVKKGRKAPAKINLYLRVTGRRPDGFHEIDSLFLPLELADTVEVEVAPAAKTTVTCSCPGHAGLDGSENLAARAAASFLDHTKQVARVDVTLEKRIWVAAGLGGGSSDAAAVLLALSEVFGAANLGPLARELGADVPFFLDARPARATGVGDCLSFLDRFPALDLVLVNPGAPLSTAAVYAALGAPPSVEWTPPVVDPGNLSDLLHNDLAAPAAALCPEVDTMLNLLRDHGATGVSLSGSGPTVFGLFADASSASTAARDIADTTGFSAVATRTLPA
jgi:4-diphosphocytidyl-2-C-methyl-D-erythritol kinase